MQDHGKPALRVAYPSQWRAWQLFTSSLAETNFAAALTSSPIAAPVLPK
jgi:hypothetical protein